MTETEVERKLTQNICEHTKQSEDVARPIAPILIESATSTRQLYTDKLNEPDFGGDDMLSALQMSLEAIHTVLGLAPPRFNSDPRGFAVKISLESTRNWSPFVDVGGCAYIPDRSIITD